MSSVGRPKASDRRPVRPCAWTAETSKFSRQLGLLRRLVYSPSMTSAIAEAREFDVTLPDGRTLHAFEAGDPSGTLCIFHHGTPTSGVISGRTAEVAAQKGIRVVSYDRAGYGGSSRHPRRRVADVAADIAVLADTCGVDRFRTWGNSGGGPHVLACAALLGPRMIAAATVASVAPFDANGLDFLAGMGQDNLNEFGAAIEGEAPLRAYLEKARREVLSTTPESLHQSMESLLPPVDRRVLTGDRAVAALASMTHGLRDGIDGWTDDDLAFAKPWGFDVDGIDVPVLVLQGGMDLMVPVAHGEWLAARSDRITSWLCPEEGHLSMDSKLAEVFEWLLEQA